MHPNRRSFLRAAAGALILAGTAPWFTGTDAVAESGAGAKDIVSLPITELSRRLAAGHGTSQQLVEQALVAIRDPAGEGTRTFLRVYDEQARAAAAASDALRRQGVVPSPIAGIPISIKDLFDIAGETTLAGSKVLRDAPPAARDATIVERLRVAGAVIIGRTNMVEFAYSGLGLNPHYGTLRNPYDRAVGRIPGGSSSGAAVSVTDGMAAGAIGTDTGGSVRIPAALCGLVGFKPTAKRVPLDGTLPLAFSLDSIGPIARTVADCALLDGVLAGETASVPAAAPLRSLRLAVPQTLVLDDLAEPVARAFSTALSRLSAAGALVQEIPLTELAQAPAVNPRGALISAEAYSWHRQWIEKAADQYDPRVLVRIKPGTTVSAPTYIELLQRRAEFIRSVSAAIAWYDTLLMPTVPDVAPPIELLEKDDETYFRYNGRMLRNPAIVNLLDGCALSIPCHEPGMAPVGLMLVGSHGTDRRLLASGLAVEEALKQRS
jgi:aspartyl-tRNA(Asn)/glutamyl-tRNA(Gln) amidotransferase subunit A